MNELISRWTFSQRTIWILLSLIALIVAVTVYLFWPSQDIVKAAWQYEDGPITTNSIGDCSGQKDHSSTVRYDHTQYPNVFYVDEFYYGGRKPDGSWWIFEQWREHETKYWEWNDPNWSLVASFGAGSWKTTGTCSSLDWWLLTNDATLDNGAYVTDRLRFKYYDSIASIWIEYSGAKHEHWLQCQEC